MSKKKPVQPQETSTPPPVKPAPAPAKESSVAVLEAVSAFLSSLNAMWLPVGKRVDLYAIQERVKKALA